MLVGALSFFVVHVCRRANQFYLVVQVKLSGVRCMCTYPKRSCNLEDLLLPLVKGERTFLQRAKPLSRRADGQTDRCAQDVKIEEEEDPKSSQ